MEDCKYFIFMKMLSVTSKRYQKKLVFSEKLNIMTGMQKGKGVRKFLGGLVGRG